MAPAAHRDALDDVFSARQSCAVLRVVLASSVDDAIATAGERNTTDERCQ
jgi:hypothetical protein